MPDFVAHLTRQAAASRATFGPMTRTDGVIDHVRKELLEILSVYSEYKGSPNQLEAHTEAAKEWVDVVILGLDGLWRAVAAANPDFTLDEVAHDAVRLIVQKQGKNEKRD